MSPHPTTRVARACIHPSVRAWQLVCLAALVAATPACMERELGPITPKTSRFFEIEVGGDAIVDVDLLFVIDNSGSMREEQESLRREIPQLVRDLTNPPLDDAGQPRWNAVESLRIAIVTSDLGTNGHGVPSTRVGAACTRNDNRGDDGQLRVVSECGGPILEWREGDPVETFVDRIGCVADVGLMGCGLEQQLLSAVKGLDAAVDFPREGAVLAVVVVSDEEDCSIADPVAFFDGEERGRQLNQRCVSAPHTLESIEGLRASLLAGRDPRDVIFSALVGVPEGLEGATPSEILADPRMQYELVETNDLGLVPACENARGQASPGRRYVELAAALEGSLISSICAESFRPAIEALAARIGSRVQGICATRNLSPDDEGAVDCQVHETLPPENRCATFPGRTLLGLDDQGREVCDVQQAVRGVASGWRYDVSNPACEQVAYTSDALPPLGTEVALVCLVEVEQPSHPTGS